MEMIRWEMVTERERARRIGAQCLWRSGLIRSRWSLRSFAFRPLPLLPSSPASVRPASKPCPGLGAPSDLGRLKRFSLRCAYMNIILAAPTKADKRGCLLARFWAHLRARGGSAFGLRKMEFIG